MSASPPIARDPWAWATLLGVLPLHAACARAPLGEPVAEDFDFLRRSLFQGLGSLLDGGGSQAFWRPLAHQVYYAVFGGLLLTHPYIVGLIHLALLALGALLLYRVFRLGMEGPIAAAAATFPLMAESTRTIVGWPTQFVDLGLFLFSALAIHEASRRRLPTALAALLAALWCKEVAVVTAALLPFLPGPRAKGERLREGAAVALLVSLWGALYLYVRQLAHLELPHGVGQLETPAWTRMAWASGGSLKAMFSLDLVPGPHDLVALGGALALLLLAVIVWAMSESARARLRESRTWIAWGLAWCIGATAALTPIHPLWQPNRSQFGSVGMGAALAPALAAAHPGLAGGAVALRLAMLALARPPATLTASDPPETGAFMDYAQLTRLQHFMHATRTALRQEPPLPSHSFVLLDNMPRRLIYAFSGDHALQAWNRDSTLHMALFDRWRREPTLPVASVLQYQPWASPQVVALEPRIVAIQEEGSALVGKQSLEPALAALATADTLDRDPRHVVFRGATRGLMAFANAVLGRFEEARDHARQALAIDPHNRNSHLVLAADAERTGRLDEADRQLDSLLADKPGDAKALSMRDEIASLRATSRKQPAP